MSGEEKKLSISVTCITVNCAEFFLSFLKYLFISYVQLAISHSKFLYQSAFMFLWNILFENDSPFEEHS